MYVTVSFHFTNVSIPLRYGINYFYRTTSKLFQHQVSIPLRYGINFFFPCPFPPFNRVSIPLRYGINGLQVLRSHGVDRVSIPLRYGINQDIGEIYNIPDLFQFLLGTE